MANDSDIKNFTAVDIEKYHKGLLSAKEMHDLEKAALDDPFLADALEGYAVSNVNAEADIAELKKRLFQRTSEAKIIPISVTKAGSRFPFLRVAVMIILIAGAGLLVYQVAFNKKEGNIAEVSELKKEEKPVDTTPYYSSANDSNSLAIGNTQEKNQTSNEHVKSIPGTVVKQNAGSGLIKTDTTFSSYAFSPQASAPVKVPDEKSKQQILNEPGKKNASAQQELLRRNNGVFADSVLVTGDLVKKSYRNDNPLTYDKQPSKSEAVASGYGTMNRQQANQNFTNIFRGRITDNNNNPVPFANITNTRDNVGTYSDAKGNFNLISPDSVLDVQVRSIGFENNNVQLRNSATGNQVVMQNDRTALNEVVVSNKKPNAAARNRDANMKLEEPEPADGWDNYDSYLANNLNVPDDIKDIKSKQGGGNVEVSFEVDKNGEPTNLKIEKSLCNKCDEEAIRLIKDGPKWKRKARKGRATVTISF